MVKFLFVFVVTVMISALWNSRWASSQSSLSSSLGVGKNIHILWSADVSLMYPPSNPLRVKLGDKLNITCPINAISNIWIQRRLQQYEECNCSAAMMTMNSTSSECDPSDTTVRHVCQDEVFFDITLDSNTLNSALSFQENTTFYLISYSTGNRTLAGYGTSTSGGQCTNGFKMAVTVLPNSDPGLPHDDVNNTIPVQNRTDTGGLGGGIINGALVNLTTGLTLSFLCLISLMAVT